MHPGWASLGRKRCQYCSLQHCQGHQGMRLQNVMLQGCMKYHFKMDTLYYAEPVLRADIAYKRAFAMDITAGYAHAGPSVAY